MPTKNGWSQSDYCNPGTYLINNGKIVNQIMNFQIVETETIYLLTLSWGMRKQNHKWFIFTNIYIPWIWINDVLRPFFSRGPWIISLSQLQFSSLVLCYNCFLVNRFECFWHVLIPFLGVNPEKNGESLKKKSPSILFFHAKTIYFRLLYNLLQCKSFIGLGE